MWFYFKDIYKKNLYIKISLYKIICLNIFVFI